MPIAFNKCIKNGGKVKTKTISKTKYMHICFLGGKSFSGEVKTKKKTIKKKK